MSIVIIIFLILFVYFMMFFTISSDVIYKEVYKKSTDLKRVLIRFTSQRDSRVLTSLKRVLTSLK
ncbi:hypothetical protein ChPV250 [Cheloniid poxvirus 1]|nr:hypothetical protein ChPV250 [Cheloniid poxvirus 1]